MKKHRKNRKILAITLAAVLCLGAAGCGRREHAAERQPDSAVATATVSPTRKPAGTATPVPTVPPDSPVEGTGSKPSDALPVHRVSNVARGAAGELSVIWLGHSSFLLQMGDKNILCDPVFSERSSPVSWAGPKRFTEAPMTAEDTPEINVLFLSHDHYDHMDRETILALDAKVGAYVVPEGAQTILAGWGIAETKIHHLATWESVTLCGIRFSMTPAQHKGGRGIGVATLAVGVFLSDGAHTVYYTGDSGYGEHFATICETFGAPDLMIAECGQYDKSWPTVHMFPEESARAAADLHATWVIPVHWGAFVLSTHAWDDSIRRFVTAAEELGIRPATPEIGQPVDYRNIASFTEHWWEAYR